MSRTDTVIITDVFPEVDCGKYYSKLTQGEKLNVSARIFTHGTEELRAELLYRRKGERRWNREEMEQTAEDLWSAEVELNENDFYIYTIEAWIDEYATWLSSAARWSAAGEDISTDIATGVQLLEEMAAGAGPDGDRLLDFARRLSSLSGKEAIVFALDPGLLEIVRRRQHRKHLARYHRELEVFVDRRAGGFSSWYELFPRSQSAVPGKHGTLRDCIARLDDIAAMGFDVLYLTPIHPIGVTGRRGKNGEPASPGDPGSPWAIGNTEGGHKSINPALGTEEDLRALIEESRKRGIEIALDIAFQCSPDHPYVREHPEWFYHRADGTIRYAENPPKRYFDIYPLNFDTDEWKELWHELKSIFEYWIDMGIRIFRVDNPHTKPISFWRWVINEIRSKHPDVIFLSEAFTREAVMFELAKIGFTQSYSYFTWKNFDYEIKEYFTRLHSKEIACFFRPNLFTNTPDILPFVLQNGGRAAFMMRALLASTLSPLWGIYSGFELCENSALPGREEYLDSEKYEIKYRDCNREGNIKGFIARLNRIRKEHPVLQRMGNLRFHDTGNPNVLMYSRDGEVPLLIVVNINPFQTQEGLFPIPEPFSREQEYSVEDLLSGEEYRWKGKMNYLKLVPGEKPGHIIRVKS
jgi:starch synthase (maltosyl-transferring)